jgi:hypothetical protein
MKFPPIKMLPLLPDHTAGYSQPCGCAHDTSAVNHELGWRMGAIGKWEQHDMVKCWHCSFRSHTNRTSELSFSSFYYSNITINA